MFLCGVLGLFFWQSTIYPVRGQSGSEPMERVTAKVEQTQKFEPTDNLEQTEIVIQEGDTLWSLAQRFKLSLDDLTQINQIASPDHIRAGQKLFLHTSAFNPKKSSIEIQPSGQSLSYIQAQSQAYKAQALNIGEVKTYEITMEDIQPSRGMHVQTQDLKEHDDQAVKAQISKEQASQETKAGKTPKVKASKDELDLLARVIYAEARGEDFEGQVAVGAVVLNRLESSDFPKTIHDVIYQPGAFTAVIDKQIHLSPDEEAYRAAEKALAGEDPTGGALYYFNPRTATDSWIKSRAVIKQIGNHTFSI